MSDIILPHIRQIVIDAFFLTQISLKLPIITPGNITVTFRYLQIYGVQNLAMKYFVYSVSPLTIYA